MQCNKGRVIVSTLPAIRISAGGLDQIHCLFCWERPSLKTQDNIFRNDVSGLTFRLSAFRTMGRTQSAWAFPFLFTAEVLLPIFFSNLKICKSLNSLDSWNNTSFKIALRYIFVQICVMLTYAYVKPSWSWTPHVSSSVHRLNSSVGIAVGCGMDGQGMGVRFPDRDKIFICLLSRR
jgi:hypothetical protein